MTGPTLPGRLRDAGLSAWELGDLLGIHPHLVRDPHPLLTGRPVRVLIEIARRLDTHPADLVPELEPLLSHRRQARRDAGGGQDRRADALTALAAARAPLSADQLARALSWQLPRTAAAIRAQDNPDLGGPLALRRIPPEPWTITPRLDVLTQAQRCALRDTTGVPTLDDDQARVLLGALAVGQKWQGGTYADLRARPGWAAAEAALRETGLIYSISGPDEVHVSDDVRFSLRYSDDDHIARELGEPPPAQAVIPPAPAGGPGRRPASEHPGPGPACAPRPGRVPGRRAAAAGSRGPTHEGARAGQGPGRGPCHEHLAGTAAGHREHRAPECHDSQPSRRIAPPVAASAARAAVLSEWHGRRWFRRLIARAGADGPARQATPPALLTFRVVRTDIVVSFNTQNAIMASHISPACHQAQPLPYQDIITISFRPGILAGPLSAACLPIPPRGSDLGPGPRAARPCPPWTPAAHRGNQLGPERAAEERRGR